MHESPADAGLFFVPCNERRFRKHTERCLGNGVMSRMRKPQELPSKPCQHCGLPFRWRRKWARDWEQVRYCSERCRRAGPR